MHTSQVHEFLLRKSSFLCILALLHCVRACARARACVCVCACLGGDLTLVCSLDVLSSDLCTPHSIAQPLMSMYGFCSFTYLVSQKNPSTLWGVVPLSTNPTHQIYSAPSPWCKWQPLRTTDPRPSPFHTTLPYSIKSTTAHDTAVHVGFLCGLPHNIVPKHIEHTDKRYTRQYISSPASFPLPQFFDTNCNVHFTLGSGSFLGRTCDEPKMKRHDLEVKLFCCRPHSRCSAFDEAFKYGR